ncbi:uncharacterized protein [Saccopteryx leptura]|uniref:uncharacterized protein n=1 Tax=Saccopteryx leptura TaxID=249018 RepID=UPI00339BAC5A
MDQRRKQSQHWEGRSQGLLGLLLLLWAEALCPQEVKLVPRGWHHHSHTYQLQGWHIRDEQGTMYLLQEERQGSGGRLHLAELNLHVYMRKQGYGQMCVRVTEGVRQVLHVYMRKQGYGQMCVRVTEGVRQILHVYMRKQGYGQMCVRVTEGVRQVLHVYMRKRGYGQMCVRVTEGVRQILHVYMRKRGYGQMCVRVTEGVHQVLHVYMRKQGYGQMCVRVTEGVRQVLHVYMRKQEYGQMCVRVTEGVRQVLHVYMRKQGYGQMCVRVTEGVRQVLHVHAGERKGAECACSRNDVVVAAMWGDSRLNRPLEHRQERPEGQKDQPRPFLPALLPKPELVGGSRLREPAGGCGVHRWEGLRHRADWYIHEFSC